MSNYIKLPQGNYAGCYGKNSYTLSSVIYYSSYTLSIYFKFPFRHAYASLYKCCGSQIEIYIHKVFYVVENSHLRNI